MRQLLTFIFTFSTAVACGQTFSYPSIAQTGHSINEFIPAGWVVLKSAWGDLNNDKAADAAIVLQYKDSILWEKDPAIGDTVLTQPRILLLLFNDPRDSSYRLVEQSNSFILLHDEPRMDDPFQEIQIINNTLEIGFYIFYNWGGSSVINTTYKFRFRENNFLLIGADYSSFHRVTHDYENYSFNFLTKKRKLEKGNDNEEGSKKTYWKSFPRLAPMTLRAFKQPFTWKVEKDFFL